MSLNSNLIEVHLCENTTINTITHTHTKSVCFHRHLRKSQGDHTSLNVSEGLLLLCCFVSGGLAGQQGAQAVSWDTLTTPISRVQTGTTPSMLTAVQTPSTY